MARTPPPPAREPLSFAQQLDRLEEIVRRLEAQELDLDGGGELGHSCFASATGGFSRGEHQRGA